MYNPKNFITFAADLDAKALHAYVYVRPNGKKKMNNNKETIMPEVSRFYGIVIKMFFKPKEHEPAHIHALYDEYMGVFDIETFEMTEGDMPNRAQKMVREWLTEHKSELQKMWQTQKIVKLPPLKD